MITFAGIGYGDITPTNNNRVYLALIILVGVGVAANLIGIFGSVLRSKEAATQYPIVRYFKEVGDVIRDYGDRLASYFARHQGDEIRMSGAQLRDTIKYLTDPGAMRSATKQLFFRKIFVSSSQRFCIDIFQ